MSSPTWIGQTLNGRYVIQELLGQGGMSAVYKASDPNLKRVVAIKLIHPHLAMDNQFVQRFEEEAAAVASLRHPNIVQVYDFNSDKDVSYMVLEFIPGETLQDHLKRLSIQNRSMSIENAIKYTLNMCDALGYAHQRGMIHRDIKPANIMLDVFGQAILMDFGIVKIIGGNQHTATGAVMGTARYMSPELIRSEPADARSDIYSLGVTLYEMLSGKTPFNADSAMTLMMMHLNDPVPDPRVLRNDLPPSLVEILKKALTKDRNQRYQSTAELAADLKKVSLSPGNEIVQDSAVTVLPDRKKEPVNHSSVEQVPLDSATLYEPRPVVRPVINPTPAAGNKAPQAQNYSHVMEQPDALGPYEKKKNPKILFLGIGAVVLILVAFLVIWGISLISRQTDKQTALNTDEPTQSENAAIVGTNTPVIIPTATTDVNANFNATLTAVALARLL
ncbi:MAG: serine/threonine protein kinase, partial [Anaerolineaceae bacterium]|nr:serine/threonine protein kinase [Anaerolineaceae bacterium]